MRDYVRRLSGRAEFLIVVLGAFGLALPSSLLYLLMGPGVGGDRPQITDSGLVQLIVYEAIVLTVLGLFLRTRGWTLERIGLRPNLRDSMIGLGLVAIIYLLNIGIWNFVEAFVPSLVEAAYESGVTGGELDTLMVLVASAINGTFEEVFVCAYIITALKERRGLVTAVNVSAALRVTYHFYQGAYGVLTITPLALLFAYWYARTGRLWPLIVAHVVLDIIGLMSLG